MDALDDETKADFADEEQTALIDQLSVVARSRVGSVLRNKLRLDTLLGVGGMAAVYAATHRNGSRFAVKMLHPEMANNLDVLRRFVREGHVANAVGHEGAVKVIDDDVTEDGSPFLVTESLDGETLEERRIRFGGKLTEDEVLSAADQLLDVLVAAHAKGVVLRDLKPENVFLTRAGQVKVLDFGIARLREVSRSSTATRTGTAMGTPAFMPPEQARGLWDDVDARSDLWAVGATMFNLLTGQLVHDGRTPNEQLLSAMTKPGPPLASVLPGTGRNVAHVVDRGLAFEKENRWPDAKRMQEAVRHAYHDRHGKPISTAPRLLVPEAVPNRTLPSVAALSNPLVPRLPTTGQGVFQTNASNGFAQSRVPRALLVTIAAGAAVAIAATGILVVSSRTPSTGTAASAAPSVEGLPTPANMPYPTPSIAIVDAARELAPTPSSIAVTALPLVTHAPEAPRPTASSTPRPPPAVPAPTIPGPSASRGHPGGYGYLDELPGRGRAETTIPTSPPGAPTGAKTNCDPPFVIDPATKKKKWKVGCL